MAVYKRGYQRYEGARTTPFERLMVLPRYSWSRLMSQRLVIAVLMLAAFWPLLCGIFVYIANHSELLAGLGVRDGAASNRFFAVEGDFFRVFMAVQTLFAVALAAMTGPGLIAPDLANNALPLYFSRPMSRWEYVLARLMVLAGMLSAVTWIPGLLIFFMQVGMAGTAWLSQFWYLGLGLLVGFLMLVVLTSLVALASSAWVKWRVVAGALVLGFFFVLAGASEMINAILRSRGIGSLLNPTYLMTRLWSGMLGVDNPRESEPGLWACAWALVAMCGLLVMVLEKKLRPVEVVK